MRRPGRGSRPVKIMGYLGPKEESKKEIERRQMEEVFKGVAERLIEELNKRCEADRQLYEEKKPALEKLQYLSELTTKL